MSTLEEKQHIGQKIHTARKNKKITQLQLGKMLSVTKKAISDYELAKINVIPFEKRVKLSSILDIPLSALLYEDEAPDDLRSAGVAVLAAYGFLERNPRNDAIVYGALEAVQHKEAAAYVDYFVKRSGEWNLGQLIYAVIRSFAILRAHTCFYNVLERLLAYRFCLAGMGENAANQYARQLFQPLTFLYHECIFPSGGSPLHLEDWFASSNISDKAFQTALSDTLQYFQQIKNNSASVAANDKQK